MTAVDTIISSANCEIEETKLQQADAYPIPADLEAIDITKIPHFEMNHFYVPPRFKKYIKKIFVPEGMLQSRWERLAERIL